MTPVKSVEGPASANRREDLRKSAHARSVSTPFAHNPVGDHSQCPRPSLTITSSQPSLPTTGNLRARSGHSQALLMANVAVVNLKTIPPTGPKLNAPELCPVPTRTRPASAKLHRLLHIAELYVHFHTRFCHIYFAPAISLLHISVAL